MNTPPILLIIFNRPKHTRKIFDELRKAKPTKLYVACDGPRSNRFEDIELVKETKEIISKIDWDCKLITLFREHNLGCKIAVSGAISWFFENEQWGIILEDDCLPDQTFFPYCLKLLKQYEYDERIMHIGGTNLQNGITRGDGSYYFSKICHIWGWATWRRAWLKYDSDMKSYLLFKQENYLQAYFTRERDLNYWYNAFDKTYKGLINSWDYQWVFTVWCNNGLCIVPQVNMISNIGFDETATHTKNTESIYANRPVYSLKTIHTPTFVVSNKQADNFSMELFAGKPPLKKRIKNKLRKFLKA